MDTTGIALLLTAAGVNVAGWLGFVGYVGRLIASGQWVPRKTHEDALKTIETQAEHIKLQDERQDTVLLEVGQTLDAVLRAIQSQAREAP